MNDRHCRWGGQILDFNKNTTKWTCVKTSVFGTEVKWNCYLPPLRYRTPCGTSKVRSLNPWFWRVTAGHGWHRHKKVMATQKIRTRGRRGNVTSKKSFLCSHARSLPVRRPTVLEIHETLVSCQSLDTKLRKHRLCLRRLFPLHFSTLFGDSNPLHRIPGVFYVLNVRLVPPWN
jgi:hypothetical protein